MIQLYCHTFRTHAVRESNTIGIGSGGVASKPAALKTVPDVVPAGPLTAGWMRQLVRVNAHDRSGDFRAFG